MVRPWYVVAGTYEHAPHDRPKSPDPYLGRAVSRSHGRGAVGRAAGDCGPDIRHAHEDRCHRPWRRRSEVRNRRLIADSDVD